MESQNEESDADNTTQNNKVQVTSGNGKVTEIDVSKPPSAKRGETTVVVEQKKPSLGDRMRTVADKIKVISDKIKTIPNKIPKAVRTMSIRIRNIVVPVDWQKMGTAVMTAYAGLLLLGLGSVLFEKQNMERHLCQLILHADTDCSPVCEEVPLFTFQP